MLTTPTARVETPAPGIAAGLAALPPGMAIRYDPAAPAIADFISGYHRYAIPPAHAPRQVDWFLPGIAYGRIAVRAGPIAVQIGNHQFDPVPAAALFGPSSRVQRATIDGGTIIGFGISALGWARLSQRAARDVHNRIVPLSQLLGAYLCEALARQLEDADAEVVAALLDAALAPLLRIPHPDERVIRALSAVIAAEGDVDVATIAGQLGVTSATLRRVALRHFGLAPKLLLRRARFLRSFLRLFRTGDMENYKTIDASYFDASHFLRDAYTFLGTTPRRFMAQATPFLDASVRAGAAILSTPVPLPHEIAATMVPSPAAPPPA